MIAVLLALQDAQAAMSSPAMLDIHFDLAHAPVSSPEGDAIVVRGRRVEVRVPTLPPLREDRVPPRIETRVLGNAMLSLDARPTILPNGIISNRAMVTLKLPF